MSKDASIHYQRIAEVIEYIHQNFQQQPDLHHLAEVAHLSPTHFQRIFTDWAGVSPKKFLQYISLAHAKQVLKESKSTLFDAAFETGLSGTGRLHDLFVTLEGMTPAEYKNGGEHLTIHYSCNETRFGLVITASTAKGICYMAFAENETTAFEGLKNHFPNAKLHPLANQHQQNALRIFTHDWSQLDQIKLHLKGTEFQLKVWETLLKIPVGQLSTYGAIAEKIENPNASRAVGTAIGSNPIAFLIPCHRVIQSSGIIGGYMWGTTRKTAILGWEAAQVKEKQKD